MLDTLKSMILDFQEAPLEIGVSRRMALLEFRAFDTLSHWEGEG